MSVANFFAKLNALKRARDAGHPLSAENAARLTAYNLWLGQPNQGGNGNSVRSKNSTRSVNSRSSTVSSLINNGGSGSRRSSKGGVRRTSK